MHKTIVMFSSVQYGVVDVNLYKQDAQLSQRDRAARCVIVFAKSSRLEMGNNILQKL